MQPSTNAKLLPLLAMGVALAWTMSNSSPVFAQRSRGDSRGSVSSRDTGASRSRGMSSGASTSRSSFNSTGRSLGGGIPQGTRSLTPSVRNPAPRSRTIVPEIRKPAAQSKTIVPNLRNLPSARKELSANNRTSSLGYETAPSRRIVLPPRGKEQPAIHSTPRSIAKGNTADSKISSPSYRVYPLRENTASQNNLSSAQAKAASDPRARSAEWKALSERLKSLAATQGRTPSSGANPLLRSQTEIPSSKNKGRLSDRQSSTANRLGMSPLARSLSPPAAKAPPNNNIASPNHRPGPSISPSVPSQRKGHPQGSIKNHPSITPYHSIFKPLSDPSAHGKPGGRSSHDHGGPHGGSPHVGSFHGGVDHRGPGHGTPRHDYRMHGTIDRHARYPGHYSYGRYGYGYRGSSLSIYLGSPLYSSSRYYYDEPYESMPYYMPYVVPVPVPVTVPYVVEEVFEPAVPVGPMVQNSAVIPAAGEAAEFQRQAEQAFQEHRYEDAARFSNHAIVEDSQNGKLHLFASQTFFALEDYASAAAAVQQAASLLDRSEWGFVVENYQEFYRGEDYVTQMAKLDEYLVQNPKAAHAYFLRGYHFLFLGHKEAARNDLAKAVELESRDRLAGELLVMAGGEAPEPGPAAPPEAEIIPPPRAD